MAPPLSLWRVISHHKCDLRVYIYILFKTVDLYDGQNLAQVQMTIFKVGGMAKKKGFAGPSIGVKVADQNVRNFSDEQLREGQSIIGLQVRKPDKLIIHNL